MSGVLVVQTAFLGDVVLTTPLLRELRRVRPACRIEVLTTPAGASLLEGQPFVDAVLAYDKRGADRGASALARRLRLARRGDFEIAIAAQRSFRSGLLVRASAAPLRIGFAKARGSWACTHRVPWDGAAHAVHRYLALAEPAGGDPARVDPHPRLEVNGADRDCVERLLATVGVGASDAILALAPGSIWGTKQWTPEGYAEVVRAAPGRGLRPVLFGSAGERDLCERIAALAGGDATSLAGRTGVGDLPALLARAVALVTNDSGPGHVAAAVGTPVVAIFGPTVPGFGYAPFGPLVRVVEHPDLACRPCHPHGPVVCPLGHHRCMREIPAGPVLAALDGLLRLVAAAKGQADSTATVRPG